MQEQTEQHSYLWPVNHLFPISVGLISALTGERCLSEVVAASALGSKSTVGAMHG